MALPTGNEAAKVQQVSKASSDQLLRKFAEADSDSDAEIDSAAVRRAARAAKRRKSAEGEICDGGSGGGPLAERKSLLAPGTGLPRSAVLRRLGISRSRDVKNRSVVRSIKKTWSKAMRGASRVFIEKHYNAHKRLISDIA